MDRPPSSAPKKPKTQDDIREHPHVKYYFILHFFYSFSFRECYTRIKELSYSYDSLPKTRKHGQSVLTKCLLALGYKGAPHPNNLARWNEIVALIRKLDGYPEDDVISAIVGWRIFYKDGAIISEFATVVEGFPSISWYTEASLKKLEVDSNAFVSTKLQADVLLSSYKDLHRSEMAKAVSSIFGDEAAAPISTLTDPSYKGAKIITRSFRSPPSSREPSAAAKAEVESPIDLGTDEE